MKITTATTTTSIRNSVLGNLEEVIAAIQAELDANDALPAAERRRLEATRGWASKAWSQMYELGR